MAGGDIRYSGDANMTDAQIAALPFEMYRQGYEYYWRTHAHPNSTFRYTTSSLLDLMRWDATDQIALIDKPLLMIAGSKADSLYMTEEAFPKATGTTDKELFRIEGATHIETYWVPDYVDAALGRLTPFFMAASIRVGLSPAQLRQLIQGLEAWGDSAGAGRARTALTQALVALNIRE